MRVFLFSVPSTLAHSMYRKALDKKDGPKGIFGRYLAAHNQLSFFFCFQWGSPEPQSFGPNFAFFREALAIL